MIREIESPVNFAGSPFVVKMKDDTTKVLIYFVFRMKKSEIIAAVLSSVSGETEIDVDAILSRNKRREVVDARHIAINILHKCGIYQSVIADIFHATTRNIKYIVSEFESRLRYNPPMRHDYERIRKLLGNSLETVLK